MSKPRNAAADKAAADAEEAPAEKAAGTRITPESEAAPGAVNQDNPVPGTAPASPAPPSDPIAALFVRSVRPEGFRRCGFRFTAEGVGIAMDALTDDQVRTLSEEPNLVVEPTWIDATDLT